MQPLFSSANATVLIHVAMIKSSLRILVKIAKDLKKNSLSLSLSYASPKPYDETSI